MKKIKLGHKNPKSKGFTLAEVLITLVIIGIIAAVTIPQIVNNYKFQQYRSGALKAMSVINQAILKYQIDYGHSPECGYNSNASVSIVKDCYQLYNSFLKSLVVQKVCTANAYQNGCIPEYGGLDTIEKAKGSTEETLDFLNSTCGSLFKQRILSDGAFVTADGIIFVPVSSTIYIVDVNGYKKPNKFGHDVHLFFLKYQVENLNEVNDIPKLTPYSTGCAGTMVEKGGVSTVNLIRNKT